MEKYVKADKIGEGSFGVAFLARIKGSNKQVVLKEINLTKVGVTFRVHSFIQLSFRHQTVTFLLITRFQYKYIYSVISQYFEHLLTTDNKCSG